MLTLPRFGAVPDGDRVASRMLLPSLATNETATFSVYATKAVFEGSLAPPETTGEYSNVM